MMNRDQMINKLNMLRPYMLAAMRIMAALLFLQHGTAKYLHFPYTPMFDNMEPASMIGLAGIFELVGGALLLVGFLTRPVAFLLSGMMAVAYFTAHAPQGFYPMLNQGEPAILFCFIFLYFVFAGPGALSMDHFRRETLK